jgi:dipeptidyl aminopeptidase/acylaminoacyl peptidase
MNVLAIVPGEFNVDDKRTHLMGHSMGGAAALFLAHGDADIVVTTDVGRRWAKKATELQMKDFEYLELPRADHRTVITRSMPDIFKFFSEHTRQSRRQLYPRPISAPRRGAAHSD